jgi:hypothetical protein
MNTCEVCDTTFNTNRSWQKYCSKTCSKTVILGKQRVRSRAAYVPVAPKTKDCRWCDEEFKTTKESKHREEFCSADCKKEHEKELNDGRMLTPESRLVRLNSLARSRAAKYGYPYNLDNEYVINLWEESKGKCSLTGINLVLGRSGEFKVHPDAPSLDKIEPKLGYVKGNVRLVSWHMNVALHEFGLDRFEQLVSAYANNKGNTK